MDDGISCTVDSCDETADEVVHTVDDGLCDDGLYCDGIETCSALDDCLEGIKPCLDECEQCNEADDGCDWCMFDVNHSRDVEGLDLSFFAGCFGACYAEASPCHSVNFDGDSGGCVGGGDFGAFSGCFGLSCGECDICWGPLHGGVAAAADSSKLLKVQLRWSRDVMLPTLPRLERPSDSLQVGEEFLLDVWASSATGGGSLVTSPGLASVYLDVVYDAKLLDVIEIMHSDEFSLLAGGVLHSEEGRIANLGGCGDPGDASLGVEPAWIRVASLRVVVRRPGRTTVDLRAADGIHSISHFGRFGAVPDSGIAFEGLNLQLETPPVGRLRAGLKEERRRLQQADDGSD